MARAPRLCLVCGPRGRRLVATHTHHHRSKPFVDVVTSPHTSGPITGAALSSLHKFLLYGFVASKGQPRSSQGVALIAAGISR
jgi:hypothetical protein